MIVAGLDLSLTATGYYFIKDNKELDLGEIKTKPHVYPTVIERCDVIACLLMQKIELHKPDIIVMEDYFSGQHAGTVIQLAALGTIVRLRLLDAGKSFLAVAPTQIKKFEMGSGGAKKDNMLKSVFQKHGMDSNSNNIADACAIAYLGQAYYQYLFEQKEDFTKYELEVLKKIKQERTITSPYKTQKGDKS